MRTTLRRHTNTGTVSASRQWRSSGAYIQNVGIELQTSFYTPCR
jgi:hypothetical protein